MSAKPCDRCGKAIVFGEDIETGKIIPLEVGQNVWRMVKNQLVTLDPKGFIRHRCEIPELRPPGYRPDFNEPKHE